MLRTNLKKIYKKIDILFDHPHKNYPIIHVTGTDGKGSTSSMIASILMEAGYKTGTFNSPANNYVKLNGDKIPHLDHIRLTREIFKIFRKFNINNYNKIVVRHMRKLMTAFLYFQEQNVDIAVVEAVCGAETDCTNIISSTIVSVLTNISGDHLDIFKTITNYAHEKAGIIKPNIPCFVGETPKDNDIKNILLNKAQECNAPITFTDEENNNLINEYKGLGEYETKYGNFVLGFGGDYQYTNLSLVLNVIEELKRQGYNITDEHIVKGLENVVKNTKLYGRWQILHRNPTVILDACHTPDAWSKIIPQLKKLDYNKLHMVIRMCKDKDINNKVSSMFLDDKNINYYFPKTNNERLINPDVWLEKTNWMQKSKRYKSTDYTINIINKLVNKVDKNDIIFIGGTLKGSPSIINNFPTIIEK